MEFPLNVTFFKAGLLFCAWKLEAQVQLVTGFWSELLSGDTPRAAPLPAHTPVRSLPPGPAVQRSQETAQLSSDLCVTILLENFL